MNWLYRIACTIVIALLLFGMLMGAIDFMEPVDEDFPNIPPTTQK